MIRPVLKIRSVKRATLRSYIKKVLVDEQVPIVKHAVVVSVVTGPPRVITVKPQGSATTIPIRALAEYATVTAGDHVLCHQVGTDLHILGHFG